MTADISYLLAFSAGVFSFLSPCVLPLIPSYFSYLTGLSSEEIRSPDESAQSVLLKHAALFVLGFSTIFILFGASATLLGRYALSYQKILQQVGGALIILFGLYATGLVKIPWFMQERRFYFKGRPAGWIGSFLIGVAFGAGWTPCVGPILGSILLYASLSESVATGIQLLAIYSLGLALPFLLAAFGINTFVHYLKGRPALWMHRVSGIFLILIGGMILTNSFTRFTGLLAEIGVGALIGQ